VPGRRFPDREWKKSNDNAIHGSSRFGSAFGSMIAIERRACFRKSFSRVKKYLRKGEKSLFWRAAMDFIHNTRRDLIKEVNGTWYDE
jgi:hypothetical protein